MKKLGIVLITCDEDKGHFPRILAEFTRLGFPFAVCFDHCCDETKHLFTTHPCCVGFHDNTTQQFDERHRQYAFDILLKHDDYDWITYLDTDEVYDRRALELIPQILDYDADLVWCPVLDLWGTGDCYMDGVGCLGPCMGPDSASTGGKQLRDKFYNLRTGTWQYRHPDIHAPYFTPRDGSRRAARRKRSNLYVLHYGLMSREDGAFHEQRWNTIYKKTLGRNPYSNGFYTVVANEEGTRIPFDYDTWEGK
jgi:hypothetical protein